MLKRLRTAHPIVFCVLAEVVFLASLFVTDLIFTIVLVLLRADFSALDTYLYSTLQELVGALIAVLFLVRTDRAGLLRRRQTRQAEGIGLDGVRSGGKIRPVHRQNALGVGQVCLLAFLPRLCFIIGTHAAIEQQRPLD